MLGAQDPLADGQQGGQVVAGSGRIPRLPGPAGQVGASGQGVRVLGAQNALHHGQQGGVLVAGPGRARLMFAAPKTDAGRLVVAIPEVIVPELRSHLARFAADGDEGLVFTSTDGTPLRHSNFRNRVWLGAVEKAGLADLHFHDLRHTGNQLAAGTGATLRELTDRMGHSTTRAALIYLHGSDQRQHEIAQALSNLAQAELKGPAESEKGRALRKASGTQRARGKRTAS